MDERGRPVIPAYQYDPAATEIIWEWLYRQPEVLSIRFVPVPLPPVHVLEAVRWRCEIVQPDHLVTGEGNTHKEALCKAALALADALHQPPIS